MNHLMAGFSRIDITPPLGISINGYYTNRKADGILDPLEANCLALSCEDKTALVMALDNLGIPAVLSVYFDVFSGFVQALVFTLLSMVYIAGACPPKQEQENM